MATSIDTNPHVADKLHPTEINAAGIKAPTKATDAATAPANAGAIEMRIAMWETSASRIINAPVTILAAINIVQIPNSLLLAVRAWSASIYAPITDMTAPEAARMVLKSSFGDIDDAAVMPMPANASSFVRDPDKSSFVIAQ
ncbi:hypothetical protein F4X86_04960 [Candidatus Saccharibacteria bacterium]|nr:hypothetical protein [Candidatus Saccharibacteria bacterium]